MKISDDYHAKQRLLASMPVPPAFFPRKADWPRFHKQSFNSYAAMNAWKHALILKIMREGGGKWKK